MRSERGEDIVTARAGRRVVRLVPVSPVEPRRFGGMRLHVPEDFDELLDETELGPWA